MTAEVYKATIDDRRAALADLLDAVRTYLRSVPDMEMYKAWRRVCELMGVEPGLDQPAQPPPAAPKPRPPADPHLCEQVWDFDVWRGYIMRINEHPHLYGKRHSQILLAALARMETELGSDARRQIQRELDLKRAS